MFFENNIKEVKEIKLLFLKYLYGIKFQWVEICYSKAAQ